MNPAADLAVRAKRLPSGTDVGNCLANAAEPVIQADGACLGRTRLSLSAMNAGF
jgi:hypothetical protein